MGLTLGGIPALFIAAYLVKSLPLGAIRWLVIVVVVYTAITLIRAGYRELSGRSDEPSCLTPDRLSSLGPDSVSSEGPDSVSSERTRLDTRPLVANIFVVRENFRP